MNTENDSAKLGGQVALFPLPGTVFYPNTHLPLHIFEPRYRKMVTDALEGDRRIGMVLLKPGWEADYYGAPPIVSVGCVGKIDQYFQFDDGKFDIVLRGAGRFRVVREEGGKPYRRADIEFLREINDQDIQGGTHPLKRDLIDHYHQLTRLLPPGKKNREETGWDSCRNLSHLVDQIAYRSNLSVEQRQSFLEEQDVLRRAETLLSVIKMNIDLIHLSKIQKGLGTDVRMN
ncbi:MAG: LON peptidase substrate-binding domain-containing protein [Nitrospinaceae bacterium]